MDESAATTGQTGSWSEGVAYDPVTRTALIDDCVFTPDEPSAGNFVTLEVEAVFGEKPPVEPPNDAMQGGLNLGTNGCFQVWTKCRPTGRGGAVPVSGGAERGWLDVSAKGITPSPGGKYRVSFVFDYAGGRYSVSVMDGKGAWCPLKSAMGAQSFPMAASGYMMRAVHFDGCTEFTSMRGSYRSFRPNGNRTGAVERSFKPNGNRTGPIEQSFSPNGNRTGPIEQSFNPNGNRTGANEQSFNPNGNRTGSIEQSFSPAGNRTGSNEQSFSPAGNRTGSNERLFV